MRRRLNVYFLLIRIRSQTAGIGVGPDFRHPSHWLLAELGSQITIMSSGRGNNAQVGQKGFQRKSGTVVEASDYVSMASPAESGEEGDVIIRLGLGSIREIHSANAHFFDGNLSLEICVEDRVFIF
jgi:hypothetical protein